MDFKRHKDLAVWRAQYKLRYLAALPSRRRLAALRRIIRGRFEHAWVADVDLVVGSRGGVSEFQTAVFRDAPIMVTVLRRTRRGPQEALCMSLYVLGKTLKIVQLQGVKGQDIPPDLADWPIRLVSACQEYAEGHGYQRVCLLRSRALGVAAPTTTVDGGAAPTPEQVERFHARITARYDGTARQLEFVEGEKWFVWTNPAQIAGRIGLAGRRSIGDFLARS